MTLRPAFSEKDSKSDFVSSVYELCLFSVLFHGYFTNCSSDQVLENHMVKLLAHWVLSALCILLVARFVPGFFVRGFGTALIAAVVIGLVNSTIGALLKIVTFPLTILTFGIFWLLINALMLKFASVFVPGFEVRGLWPAFWGGLILSVLNMIVRQVLNTSRE